MTPVRGVLIGMAFLFGVTSCAPETSLPYSVDGDAIPAALEGKAGDVERGRAVFVDRDGGHCLLCHAVSSLDDPFHGTLGPDLSAVGSRYTAAQIRLRVANASILNPATVMPAYFRLDGLNQVGAEYRGETALSAQEIEDIVAYLVTLREDAILE